MNILNRQQKEAVGLLQIGTFLEYFDLMLYVHMAVLLNELFFPKTDPHTAAILAALAFCSTYLLRPFGALIFGYIGDTIGRKSTVVLTTILMSISCIIMANLPTYEKIGIAACWLITLCRVMQGLSSMGEIIGAQIYLTELIKPPMQYPVVAFVSVASQSGTMVALAIAALVTHCGFEWRLAFWIGAGIAMVGSIARVRLRETPEFLIAQKQKARKEHSNIELEETKISKKTLMAFFCINAGAPLSFYLAYIYFNPLLKQLNYTATDIILHNLWLSLINVVFAIFLSTLSYKVYPLKISKTIGYLSAGFIIFLPYLILRCTHPLHIFLLQALWIVVSLRPAPSQPILLKAVPVFNRFKIASFLYAFSHTLMYVLTSFGLVYLTEWFGYWGIWILALPTITGFLWGIYHFEKVEGVESRYTNYFKKKAWEFVYD